MANRIAVFCDSPIHSYDFFATQLLATCYRYYMDNFELVIVNDQNFVFTYMQRFAREEGYQTHSVAHVHEANGLMTAMVLFTKAGNMETFRSLLPFRKGGIPIYTIIH